MGRSRNSFSQLACRLATGVEVSWAGAAVGRITFLRMRDLMQLGAPLRRVTSGDPDYTAALNERPVGIRSAKPASRWRMS